MSSDQVYKYASQIVSLLFIAVQSLYHMVPSAILIPPFMELHLAEQISSNHPVFMTVRGIGTVLNKL